MTAALWGVMAMTAAEVSAESGGTVDQAARKSILDAARVPVTRALGKPVLFRVRQIRIEGEWAFLLAHMEEQGGRRVDYAGTPKAEAAAQGMVSDTYAALLRRHGQAWTAVADAVGPTDVAWEGWAARYGAPAGVFKP